jgi:predicted solute-binding protein
VYDDRRLASEIALLLTTSRDDGCERLPAVAEDIARTSGLDAMLVYDYLSRGWSYELGEEELEGVHALNDLARKYDLIRDSRFTTAPAARTV